MEPQNDHDLLIELRGDVKALRTDIQEMKDGTKETIKDHEIRLRFLERYVWIALGAVALLQIYFFYKQAFPNS